MQLLSKREYKKTFSNNSVNFFNPTFNNDLYRYLEFTAEYQFDSLEFGKILGKPPFKEMNAENYPGVWAWHDTTTDIYWALITDAFKKNSYKGGSLEFVWNYYTSQPAFDCGEMSPDMLDILFESATNFMNDLMEGKNYIVNPDCKQLRLKLANNVKNRI